MSINALQYTLAMSTDNESLCGEQMKYYTGEELLEFDCRIQKSSHKITTYFNIYRKPLSPVPLLHPLFFSNNCSLLPGPHRALHPDLLFLAGRLTILLHW